MSDIMIVDMLGLSKIATGTPSPLARTISGGQLAWDTHQVVRDGIGGQRLVRKGVSEVRIRARAEGIALADWGLWIPGSLTTSVAGFPDMLAKLDDGGSLGGEWVLSGGQPASLELAWTDAPDGMLDITIEALFALATPSVLGTDDAVYYDDSVVRGYGAGDVGIELDGADPGFLAWTLRLDLGAIIHNPATVKEAEAKSFADAVYITRVEPKLEVITSEPLKLDELAEDEYTAGEFVITLDNGVESEDAVITVSDMITSEFNLPWEGSGRDENRVGFAHQFTLGTTADRWGSVTLA